MSFPMKRHVLMAVPFRTSLDVVEMVESIESPVNQCRTCGRSRSRVERSEAEHALLKQHGGSTLASWTQSKEIYTYHFVNHGRHLVK